MKTRILISGTPEGFPVFTMPDLDFSKIISRKPIPTKGTVRMAIRDMEPIGDRLTYSRP